MDKEKDFEIAELKELIKEMNLEIRKLKNELSYMPGEDILK